MDAARLSRYPFVPGPVPLTVVGGEGVWLHTDDGRRILDGAGGAVVANIGHGRPEPAAAAAEVLQGYAYTVPPFATEARVRLIERLVGNWLPEGMTRCLFVAGGSESVDSALRIARQHHVCRGDLNRTKIIGRSISYHGATLASLAVANHDRRRAGLEPMLADWPKADALDAEAVRKLVEAEDPGTIAAIIAEPVSGASGAALVPPDDYLPGLRSICDDHGILLISDEVMAGFGRTGANFGIDHAGVVPDLLVGGKGLGGGYVPMGGVFATEAVVAPIAEAGQSVMYFTFSGSDIVCAVADRVLQVMEDEDLVARAAVQGERLRALLTEALGDHPNVADIRGRGLLMGLELVADRSTGATFAGRLSPKVVSEALERNCWVYPAGSAAVPDGILFGPAFTITDGELEQLVAITAEALDAAVASVRATEPASASV
ncbi:MAG: aminotransferase class III-fold pyridoxal phosphate-dependent enzyme [Acidimicrobiia bacterium]|nr:aminotransferase class III-fold pyridoxal phosphate-dependent enzyme [Acidimicrobiia bacterium]